MTFQYEDKTKYKIKKPMCATCDAFLHAFIGRNCALHKDSYGRTFKRFEPTDVCNNYSQVGDWYIEEVLPDILEKSLIDDCIERK